MKACLTDHDRQLMQEARDSDQPLLYLLVEVIERLEEQINDHSCPHTHCPDCEDEDHEY